MSQADTTAKEKEMGAILVLKQSRDVDGDRVPITREQMAIVYAQQVVEYGMSIPPAMGLYTPQSRYGPYRIGNTLEVCEHFIEHTNNIVTEIEVPIDDGSVELKQVELEVTLINLATELEKKMAASAKGKAKQSMSTALIDSLTAHVSAEANDNIIFYHASAGMFKEAWAAQGFVVEKINRQALKVDDKRTSTKGATFHMNVRPKEGKLSTAAWPPALKCKLKIGERILPVTVEYKIFSHPALDGKICTEVCHRYYQHYIAEAKLDAEACGCKRGKERAPRSSGGGDAAVKQAALAQAKKLALEDCMHYTIGKCMGAVRGGGRCRRIHKGDPSGIACAHAKGKDGECKYGVRCFYNYPPTDEEAVAAGVRPPPLDSG